MPDRCGECEGCVIGRPCPPWAYGWTDGYKQAMMDGWGEGDKCQGGQKEGEQVQS